MRNKLYASLLVVALLISVKSYSQSDSSLIAMLDGSAQDVDYTYATFKTNRIINLHSIENTVAGVLDVKISHRFGLINQGLYDIFGLDAAQMHLNFDLGLTDRLAIGVGRTSLDKAYNGFVKYKILKQSTGSKNMPVSVSFAAGTVIKTSRSLDPDPGNTFWYRVYYDFGLLIARKFSENFSLQVTPTLVHRNLVRTAEEKNDVFAIGVGARQKLTRRMSINAEYIYVLPGQLAPDKLNSLSVGLDIETGGHVFQLHFTNSQGMNENAFITETINRWDKFEFRFGFNLSRVFTLWEPAIRD